MSEYGEQESRVPAVSDSLRARTFKGGRWGAASALVQGVMQFVVGVVLARLLLPEDFGLAALAMLVVGLAKLVSDVGIGAAVVQRYTLTPSHLRVAFTFSLLTSLAIAALLVLLAPTVGLFSRNPGVTSVLQVQSILFVALGTGTVAQALLQRELNFRRLFHIDVASYLIGYAVIAVGGALLGWGVWSLVVGTLAQGILMSALSLIAVRPPLRPLIRTSELRELLGFGMGVTLNGLVAYVGRNGDNFLVGRVLGATALGLYSRAFNLMMLPINYLSNVLPSVLIPAFSEIQRDRARVGRGYLLGVEATTMASAPFMVGVIVAAPHLILGLYGDNWVDAVLPLQIIAVAGVSRALLGLSGAVTRACDCVHMEIPLQLCFALAVTIGTVLGARWGLGGVAALVSAAIVMMSLAQARVALQITGASWRGFAQAHIAGAQLAIGTAAVAIPIRLTAEHAGLSHLAVLFSVALMSATAAFCWIYLAPIAISRYPLFWCSAQLAERLPPRLQKLLQRGAPVAT